MSQKGKYIYCIIQCNGKSEFAVKGIDDEPVYAVSYQNLAVVVSDFSSFKVDFNPANLKTHELVIEEVMKDFTALPVGFGCIAGSAGEIEQKVLKQNSAAIHKLLQAMENKVELVVKALWKDDRIYAQVAHDHPRLGRLFQKITTRSPQKALLQQMQAGQTVKATVDKLRDSEAKKILAFLEPIAVDKRLKNITSPEMILNASFLVSKEREKEFDDAVNGLGEKYGSEIKFIYVGPLPPYDFIDLKIRL